MTPSKHKHLLLTLVILMISNLTFAQNANPTQSPIGDTLIFSLLVFSAIILLLIIYAQAYALRALLESREDWSKEGQKSSGKGEKMAALAAFFILSQSLFAQGGAGEPLIRMTTEIYWLLIGLNAFLLGVIITLYYVLKGLISNLRGEEEPEVDTIAQISASLTDAVPIEREEEILLDHDYDGIRELDNNLPPWWKYGFYMTIVFAFAYLIYYHLGGGDLQLAEYNKQMEEGQAIKEAFLAQQANMVDESNLEVLTDAGRLESGKKVYMDLCKVCHGEKGEGLVGPNFTDQYWKHGGSIANIYSTIKVGVPDKGMISWESQLTPGQIHEVASYILTLQGTNPPNQKAPEGDLWEAEQATPVEAAPTEEIPTEETPLEEAPSEEPVNV